MASTTSPSLDLPAGVNADLRDDCVTEKQGQTLKRDRQLVDDSAIVSRDAKRQRTALVGRGSSSVSGTVVTHESSDEVNEDTADELHPRDKRGDGDHESVCEVNKQKNHDDDDTLSNGDVPFEVNVCHSSTKDDDAESTSNQVAEDKSSSSEDENDKIEESDDECESNYDSDYDSDGDHTVLSGCDYESILDDNDNYSDVDEKPKLRLDRPPAHDLFLPSDRTLTYEDLQYRLDDEGDGFMMTFGPILPYHLNSSSSSVTDSSTDSSSVSSNNPTSSSKKPRKSGKKKGVSFNDSITVRPIFQLSDYSPSMFEGMYTNRFELQANRRRNYEEYLYENKNWLEVVEEHEMIRDVNTGQLVHPAHSHFIHADLLGGSDIAAADLTVGPDAGLDLNAMLNFWN